MEQPIGKIYTYSDLLALDENTRAEIIYGDLYMMSPAPTGFHQKISVGLESQILDFLKDRPCEMFHAPMNVRLFEKDDDSVDDVDTVVQPDIFVVCNSYTIDEHGCRGVPGFIIEILSKSTAKRDRHDKKRLYERAGVREYWIVDPVHYTVEVFLLDGNGKFTNTAVYGREDTALVNVLPGCELDLSRVFPENKPPKKYNIV